MIRSIIGRETKVYRQIQATQIHGSRTALVFYHRPEYARSTEIPVNRDYRHGHVAAPGLCSAKRGGRIGLICSEKQAIDATLQSLAREDPGSGPGDRYWNARGGSYTDGGAFIFSVQEKAPGTLELTCCDKFGREITVSQDRQPYDFRIRLRRTGWRPGFRRIFKEKLAAGDIPGLFNEWKSFLAESDYRRLGSGSIIWWNWPARINGTRSPGTVDLSWIDAIPAVPNGAARSCKWPWRPWIGFFWRFRCFTKPREKTYLRIDL